MSHGGCYRIITGMSQSQEMLISVPGFSRSVAIELQWGNMMITYLANESYLGVTEVLQKCHRKVRVVKGC